MKSSYSSDEEILTDLRQKLIHKFIKNRREGIKQAEECLQAGLLSDDIVNLLLEVKRNDRISVVRNDAMKVLSKYDIRNQTAKKPDEIRVKCPKGHVSVFNMAEICHNRTIYRKSQPKATASQEIFVKCRECAAEMVLDINCEEYE